MIGSLLGGFELDSDKRGRVGVGQTRHPFLDPRG